MEGERHSWMRGQQTRRPLYDIYCMYITHEYFTYTDCTESDAEINRNIALTLVVIIVRISLK